MEVSRLYRIWTRTHSLSSVDLDSKITSSVTSNQIGLSQWIRELELQHGGTDGHLKCSNISALRWTPPVKVIWVIRTASLQGLKPPVLFIGVENGPHVKAEICFPWLTKLHSETGVFEVRTCAAPSNSSGPSVTSDWISLCHSLGHYFPPLCHKFYYQFVCFYAANSNHHGYSSSARDGHQGHFTHKTECPWPMHFKHSHRWKRRSLSEFASHYAWGTNGVCECKIDVKSTWIYKDLYMASNGSYLMVTWTIFKSHLFKIRLTQNRRPLWMLTTVDLFYLIICENMHE